MWVGEGINFFGGGAMVRKSEEEGGKVPWFCAGMLGKKEGQRVV